MPTTDQKNRVHVKQSFHASILTERLDNVNISFMVDARAMQTTSKLWSGSMPGEVYLLASKENRFLYRILSTLLFWQRGWRMQNIYLWWMQVYCKQLRNSGDMSSDLWYLPTAKNSGALQECISAGFYFDKTARECKEFVFGGCKGNANNFETLEAYKARCRK